MATVVDVSPSLGQGAVPLQAGPGASPGFSAIDHRRAWTIGLQEGAIDSGSYKVSEDSGGASMDVEVAASTGDGCVVQGDDVTSQGRYYVAPHSGTITLTIEAADTSNPRVDQIVLEVEDDTHDSSALNKARVRIVKGTATSGATLDNRTGAAALPNGAMRLADVLVPASDTTISNSQIRDRRTWARGAYYSIVRNADASASDDYTTTSSSMAAIDSTNLNPRIECSGAPLRVTLIGSQANSGAGNQHVFGIRQDGSAINGGPHAYWNAPVANYFAPLVLTWTTTPAAGSHQFAPYWSTSAGTATLYARAAFPLQMLVEELVRQNTSN